MVSLRSDIEQLELGAHGVNPGLWLDRFVPNQDVQGTGGTSRTEFFHGAAEYLRWPAEFEQFRIGRRTGIYAYAAAAGAHVLELRVRVNTRLVTGMGAANVLENGLALHRTYGVPILPGSGLKGLAARVARLKVEKDAEKWAMDGEYYRALFGSTEEAGCVEFHDGLPLVCHRLIADVLTPHTKEGEVPSDTTSPNPVPFFSVRGDFELFLVGPEEWTALAARFLLHGLKEEGFGGKTSSGYGRASRLPDHGPSPDRAEGRGASTPDPETSRQQGAARDLRPNKGSFREREESRARSTSLRSNGESGKQRAPRFEPCAVAASEAQELPKGAKVGGTGKESVTLEEAVTNRQAKVRTGDGHVVRCLHFPFSMDAGSTCFAEVTRDRTGRPTAARWTKK